MISVGSVFDLLVPSAKALSACRAAARAWDLPATMSGSSRTTSPPMDVKWDTMVSKGAGPLIPMTSKRMTPSRVATYN